MLGSFSALALGPQRLEPLQGLIVSAKLDVDLRQPDDGHGRRGLSGGERLVELLDGFLQVVWAPPRLVQLALEQVQGSLHIAWKVALIDLLEQRANDRLGFLGIAGLEDRPGGPQLVLGFEAAESHGVLEVLSAEIGLLGQDQCHTVACLDLGELGQRGSRGLEVDQGAGAKCRRISRRRGTGPRRITGQARAVESDRAGEQVAESLKPRQLTIQERLDVGIGLGESLGVLDLSQDHFGGHRVQAHHQFRARPPRPLSLGGLQRPVDDLKAAIGLPAEPKVVSVGPEGLEVGLPPLGQGLLENRVQIDFDRGDQAVHRLPTLRWELHRPRRAAPSGFARAGSGDGPPVSEAFPRACPGL